MSLQEMIDELEDRRKPLWDEVDRLDAAGENSEDVGDELFLINEALRSLYALQRRET